ncbi:MAG TPA: HAD family hydrolase, partial [Gemmataceae bacterium]|nr:HAD family hydrolase [Gemmataceae bacterium]
MSFDAYVFDFDGTLADSFTAITSTINYVRGLRGYPPLALAAVKCHVGLGAENLLEQTVPGTDIAIDLPRYREHHPTVMFDQTWLLPGALETLTTLRKRGRKVALCSNKPRIFTDRLLDRLDITPFFDAVLGPEDVPHPKPAPDMLLAALRRLELAANRVLYIGDMTVDIQTARS